MDGFDVVDLVMTMALLVLLGGLSVGLMVRSSRQSTARQRARKWLTAEFGSPDHPGAELVRTQQVLTSRLEGLASLAGLVVALTVFPPQFTGTRSPVQMWCLGWSAGLVASQFLIAIVLVRRSRPPAGVRVASSAPHRIGDYVSRWGVVLLAAAVIAQIVRIEVAMRAAGGTVDSVATRSADVAALTMIIITVAVAAITPWLVSRPLHAANDAELDIRVRLRRDRVGFLARVLYPQVFIGGMAVSQIGQDQLPGEYYDDPLWLGLVALALAFGGYMLQWRFERSKQVVGPHGQASRPYGEPREWEPAPGTNGWILPGRSDAHRP